MFQIFQITPHAHKPAPPAFAVFWASNRCPSALSMKDVRQQRHWHHEKLTVTEFSGE